MQTVFKLIGMSCLVLLWYVHYNIWFLVVVYLPRSEFVVVWSDGGEILQLWQDDASWTSGRTQVSMQLLATV